MTQVLSKLAAPNGPASKFSRLAIASSSAALLYWGWLVLRKPARAKRQVLFVDKKALDRKSKSRKRADLGATLRQLQVILKSVMRFQDVALACGVSLGLILRTLLDLWNIRIATQVESAIITANLVQLRHTLLSFAITMPTMALVNNIIKFFGDRLRLSLRYSLSKELYERYMTDLTFYQLAQGGEFQNVDQLLTADVDKFCTSIVEVYNNLSKPVLDIILLVHRLTNTYTGPQTPAIMIGWLAFVGSVLTQARRPLSGYIIRETQSEGQLRFVHSRLIQNSEEVAFFKGNDKEKHTLISALDSLKDALEDSILFKLKIGFVDNIVGRYSSTIVGYLALALPFFSTRYTSASSEERLNQYYISGRMMMKLAESITRVILAGQDLNKLAAYTQRVDSLMNSMRAIQKRPEAKAEMLADCGHEPIGQKASVEICDPDKPMIDFKGVTLSTPGGDILVKDLTFTIKPKQSVIIAGPNGSGKSSLFRVLGDLWPVDCGRLVKPAKDQLFYICQKPYMTLGSFRSQLIFPDKESRLSDEQLTDILDVVELRYLLGRDHTFDSVNDWQDVLSGGEKQRMALARLIYHRPKFAILDECTSAVAIDVEQKIYKYLSEQMDCTLLSVSHRVKQLAKFHHLILEFDGNGGYDFKRIVAPI